MVDPYYENQYAPQVESHQSAIPEVGQSVPQWLYPRNARSTSFPMSRNVSKKDAPHRNVQQSTETLFVPSEQNQNRMRANKSALQPSKELSTYQRRMVILQDSLHSRTALSKHF